jgi:hypothetical protein
MNQGHEVSGAVMDETVKDPQITTSMIPNPLKVGKYRNKKCLCGSTKKVKVCCGVMKLVPFNLGNFWIHVIKGDKVRAQFFAEAWESDVKAANEIRANQEKANG